MIPLEPAASGAVLENTLVMVVHPAWHSCGSHAVFVSQVAAYQTLGATVVALAVGTTTHQRLTNARFWRHYHAMTRDLVAHERFHTGPSFLGILLRRDSRRRAMAALASDYARQTAAYAELSPLPAGLLRRPAIDLIHCNHYFNMPLALRLKERFGTPILLETHDVQSRQYELRGAVARLTRRRASYEEMLRSELEFVGQADALTHINADEHAQFMTLLPHLTQVLNYPAVFTPTTCRSKHFFLIVASANYPNLLSVEWFLRRVLPFCNPIQVHIVGNVDTEFQAHRPGLYERHQALFRGRVADLTPYYEGAAAVLLPTIAGHGLSIKTVEAMGVGVPLVATPLAFRGLTLHWPAITNLHLAETPRQFAEHINALDEQALQETRARLHRIVAGAGPHPSHDVQEAAAWLEGDALYTRRMSAATRKAHDDVFSFPAYCLRLERIARKLIKGE